MMHLCACMCILIFLLLFLWCVFWGGGGGVVCVCVVVAVVFGGVLFSGVCLCFCFFHHSHLLLHFAGFTHENGTTQVAQAFLSNALGQLSGQVQAFLLTHCL